MYEKLCPRVIHHDPNLIEEPRFLIVTSASKLLIHPSINQSVYVWKVLIRRAIHHAPTLLKSVVSESVQVRQGRPKHTYLHHRLDTCPSVEPHHLLLPEAPGPAQWLSSPPLPSYLPTSLPTPTLAHQETTFPLPPSPFPPNLIPMPYLTACSLSLPFHHLLLFLSLPASSTSL